MTTGAGRLRVRGPSFSRPGPSALAAAPPLLLAARVTSLIAAQLFDFGTFTVMVGRHGIAAEANPLVANGFAVFGMPILVLMKVALIVLLASIVVILARERRHHRSMPDIAAFVTLLAVVGGLIGGISNVLAG